MEHHKFTQMMCEGCLTVHTFPVYCGNRFCDICGRIQKYRIRERVSFLLKHAVYPYAHSLQMITLHFTNQKDLDSMVKHLIKSFRKLRSRQYWKSKVFGGVYVIEITGRPGNWHAHIHALVSALYIKWETMLKHWRKCCIYPAGCYVTRLPRSTTGHYLTKYVTKPTDIDIVDEQYNNALKGTRLFSAFGHWYHINLKYVKPLFQCSSCKLAGSLHWMGCGEFTVDQGGKPVDIEENRLLSHYLAKL